MAPGTPYDLNRPFVARQGFTFDGVEYAEGAVFPWRQLGLTERDVWDRYRTLQIKPAPPGTIGATCAGSAPSVAPKPAKRPRAGA